MLRWEPNPCPTCGTPLEGLGRYCERCAAYVADMVAKPTTKCPGPKDTRLEDERKADALPVVTALGWAVYDFEQGYRPDACPKCGAHLPGGHSTRVPVGVADWLCQGHGIAAWIEWKTDDNDQTPGQRRFGDECDVAGIPYAVCRNTRDAVDFLTGLRARSAA